jgi:hypothetical protein
VTGRFTGLLRQVRDPAARAIGRWSVAETGAHVAASFEVELDVLAGRGTPQPDRLDITELNEHGLAHYPERDPRRVADRIDELAGAFADRLRSADASEQLTWHGGLRLQPVTVGAVMLSDVLVHGFDIGRASATGWRIERPEAAAAVEGLLPLLPYYVDTEAARGFTATFELAPRGGNPHLLQFLDGQLTIDPPGAPAADCRLLVDPAAYLLVGYRRLGQWGPLLRGQLLALGRRPWLGFKLTNLLANP